MAEIAPVYVSLDRIAIRCLVDRFFSDIPADSKPIMVAIALAESGGRVNIIGDNYESGHQAINSPARWDYGLFQVNSQHTFDKSRLLSEPDYNAACAAAIFAQQGLQAWSSYNAGTYMEHMEGDTSEISNTLKEFQSAVKTTAGMSRREIVFGMLQILNNESPSIVSDWVKANTPS